MKNDTLTVVTLTFANTPIRNMCAYIYVFYKTYCHKCHKCHFNMENSELECDSICDGCDGIKSGSFEQDWARLTEDYEDFRQSHSEIAEPNEYVDARKLPVTSLLLYDFMRLDWVGSDGFVYRPEKIFTKR